MAIRPTYSEKSRVVQSIWNAPSRLTSGPGTYLTIMSSRGLISPEVALESCEANPARPDAKDVGEVSLLFAGSEFDKGVEISLRTSSGRQSGRSILLITTIGRILLANASSERTWSAELAFKGVDEHKGTVGHLKRTLDLATKVGVTRGINNVDFGGAIIDSDVLREDGDPSLSLKVIRVENTIAEKLAGPELSGLFEHGINQRGLTMVDVGDDRHVADIVATGHGVESARVSGGPVTSGKNGEPDRFAGSIRRGGLAGV